MKKLRSLLVTAIFVGVCVNCCVSAYKGLRVEVFRVPAQIPVVRQLRELNENVLIMSPETIMAKLTSVINTLEIMKKDGRHKFFDDVLSFMSKNQEKICVSEETKSDYEKIYSKILYYKSLPLTPRIRPMSPLLSPTDGWNVQMNLA